MVTWCGFVEIRNIKNYEIKTIIIVVSEVSQIMWPVSTSYKTKASGNPKCLSAG